jgi:hypothetical protein
MSKVVKITESEIINLVKKVIKEQSATRRKTINEGDFSDGKFRISHAGVPVNQIMVSVESSGIDDGDASFTIEFDGEGNGTIVDFFNYSEEIDDDEVKSYMESMLANGALRNAPDFISFDPETGELD